MANPQANHIPALDGVRGLAILLVLVHTANIIVQSDDLVGQIVSRLAGLGWVGVQLFFVLSGFLITRYLLSAQGATNYFRVFYVRRILRIFPLYYATLAFFFVLLPAIQLAPVGVMEDRPNQVWFWLFLSNWTEWIGWGGLSLPHFWSLAVEEQFYLAWPLIVYKASPRTLIKVCILLATLSLASRCVMVLLQVHPLVIYTSSIGRVDALVLGALVAAVFTIPEWKDAVIRLRHQLLIAAAIVLVSGKVLPQGYGMIAPVGQTLGYSLLAISFALFIAWCVACAQVKDVSALHKLLQVRWLGKFGQLSYAMYVFHAPLNTYVGAILADALHWKDTPSTIQGLMYIIIIGVSTCSLAWLSSLLIENPFNRLKHHFALKYN